MSWLSSQGSNICLELPFVPEQELEQMRLKHKGDKPWDKSLSKHGD